MTYSATYSPEDNKLRLSASSRLDAETYARVKAAGFSWAPKQEIFVAPMWTPSREDLCLELAGEIDDEDTSLVARAEQRAERFEDYSDSRAKDAERAHSAVSAIADNIPLGQPILVGHHSEKHARRDAEKIENGMRRAVKMWDTAQYWKSRAVGAIMAAKYKELPAVRARRIKGIEADKRREERARDKAALLLKFWSKDGLTHEEALRFVSVTDGGWLQMPRKDGDKPDFEGRCSAYDALSGSYPTLYAPRTLDEVVVVALRSYPQTIAHCGRWIAHLDNRLVYERAMLEDQGAIGLLDKKPRPALLPICNYRAPEGLDIENIYNRGNNIHYAQVEMTQAEYAEIYSDYRGTRVVDRSHRVRTALVHHAHVCVFITDSKTHKRPEPIEAAAVKRIAPPVSQAYTPKPVDPAAVAFDALREALKAGVQVVSAPQLFPTPPELARRMVEAADIQPGNRVLEPSAGTGNILKAIIAGKAVCDKVSVEINPRLATLCQTLTPDPVICGDFLEQNGNLGKFDVILMNPPFANGQDIKHIEHALQFLKPGGRLVAICANGPRQNERLRPMVERLGGTWEPLPDNTFKESGTGVRAVLMVI